MHLKIEKMKKVFLYIVAACIIGNIAHAQVPAQLVAILNQTLDSMRIVTGAQSLSAAMQFGDGNVWSDAKGISSLTQEVTPNHAYLIGSVSKTLTASCILQFADQGLLNLNDSLHEWLPSLPHINANITIRQLLNHTSGIFDVLAHPNCQDSLMANLSRLWLPEDLIARFMMPPNFAPGTSWSYSNTNYMLLAMIIKEITGNPFYTEFRNRFFTTMNLPSFASMAFEPISNPVAHVWLDINGDNVEDDAHNFYMSYKSLNSTAGAGGSYFATATDCTRFMRSCMRGDVFSTNALSNMKEVVAAPGSQGGLYGLGIMQNTFQGMEAWGHGGDLAYHASSWYLPEKDLGITVLTNANSVNSWELLKVVDALIKSYRQYDIATKTRSVIVNIKEAFIFPNPFQNSFWLQLSAGHSIEDAVITLHDITGKVAYQKVIATNNQPKIVAALSGSTLNTGIYWANVVIDGVLVKTIKLSKL